MLASVQDSSLLSGEIGYPSLCIMANGGSSLRLSRAGYIEVEDSSRDGHHDIPGVTFTIESWIAPVQSGGRIVSKVVAKQEQKWRLQL